MWVLSLLTNHKVRLFAALSVVIFLLLMWHRAQVTDYRQQILNEVAAEQKVQLEVAIKEAKRQWLADGDNIITVEKIITKYKTEVKYEKIEVPSECTGYVNAFNVLLDSHIDTANRAIESNR